MIIGNTDYVKLLNLINSAPVGILTFNRDGEVTFSNENFMRYIDYYCLPQFSGLGHSILPFFSDLGLNTEFEELKKSCGFEKEIKTARMLNGAEIPVILKCAPVQEEGVYDGGIVIIEDLLRTSVPTEIQNNETNKSKIEITAEEYLEFKELKDMHAITTCLEEALIVTDEQGNIVHWNDRAAKIFLMKRSQIFGKPIGKVISQLTPHFFWHIKTELEGKGIWKAELRNAGIRHREFYIDLKAAKVNSSTGTRYAFRCQDITLKKESEKILRKSEELQRNIVNYLPQPLLLLSSDGRILFVNSSFLENSGLREDLIKNKPVQEVLLNEEVGILLKNYERTEIYFNDKNFIADPVPFSAFSEECILVSFTDITDIKNAEIILEESEERYRNLAEGIDAFLWTAENSNGTFKPVFYTSAVEKITGYTDMEFYADKKLWFRIIHPDDFSAVKKHLRSVYNDKSRLRDEFEFRIISRTGNTVWIKNKINIYRDQEGRRQKVFGLVSDITLNKKGEEELKRSAEALKELNDTKDKFISIISHDLRTPFSSILGFTDLLLSDRELSDEQKDQYITFISESSKNMLALVNSLLDWTRLQTGRIRFEPSRLNVTPIAEKAVRIISGNALQKGIQVESHIGNNVYAHADEALLLQVFNNLLSNAIKFTPKGGHIVLDAEPDTKNNLVRFSVRDTGVGIKEENLGKLFKVDSKFTLEGTSGEKGSGLGLSLVHDIIKKHGGNITVRSMYGKGSEFIFTIPISSTSILIVGDNKTERLLYSKILKNIIPGYTVEFASNGNEAFEIISSNAPAIVISEHSIPLMGGYELVKKIRGSSALKVIPPVIILITRSNKSVIEEYKELGVEYVFTKPVNLSIFKEAIEHSLRKALFISD